MHPLANNNHHRHLENNRSAHTLQHARSQMYIVYHIDLGAYTVIIAHKLCAPRRMDIYTVVYICELYSKLEFHSYVFSERLVSHTLFTFIAPRTLEGFRTARATIRWWGKAKFNCVPLQILPDYI